MGSRLAFAAAAAAVAVTGLVWWFRSDPYSLQATAPQPDEGLTLARPSIPPPGTAQSGTAQPGTAQPGTAQPGTAQPGTAQPGTAQPGTAQPGTATTQPPGAAEPTVPTGPQGRVQPSGPVSGPPAATARPQAPVVPPPPPPKPKKGAGVVEVVEGVNLLSVPAPSSGQGLLTVTASPWGVVSLDGRELGETPREVRAGEGAYRVRITHPTLGARESTVIVTAGKRSLYNVRFSR